VIGLYLYLYLYLYMASGWVVRSMARGAGGAVPAADWCGASARPRTGAGILHVTPKGLTNLRCIAALVPLHEQYLFGRLSRSERSMLYGLLRKADRRSNPRRARTLTGFPNCPAREDTESRSHIPRRYSCPFQSW